MAVVTTCDSPCCMPCQDKSTIQLKSSVLSVDMWPVLSPGGPIVNGVSSNVSAFGFFVCFFFWAADNGTSSSSIHSLPQNGCADNYKRCDPLARESQRRERQSPPTTQCFLSTISCKKMNFTGKMTHNQQKSDENVHSFFKPSQMAMGPPRQRLQVGNIIPKRKLWSSEQTRGPKRVKVEVKSTQTEETQCSTDGMTSEAYDLMVVETPPSNYWKETAEERRKALYVVMQENKKMHKYIEAKEEQITQLKCENEELQALAQHVQYMADMIERLTGKSPDNLEELQDIALEEEDDADSDFSHSDSVEEEPSDHHEDEEEASDHEEDEEDEEEASDHEEAGPSSEQD
ncbi:hypothetical protein F7725_025106 [Dissostichus mawsoni]|uniref:Geminin n=1 Tax=Dissostichus mawsoni TaxID=36200 RepID=A0A7J5XA81_DISMA|nr:hypothetical protein F7725_025106 [Dissostichus mawsoni]